MNNKKCKHCKEEIGYYAYSNAIYCGNACRQAHYRKRKEAITAKANNITSKWDQSK